MKDLDASPGFDPVSALPSLREALTLAFRSWKTIVAAALLPPILALAIAFMITPQYGAEGKLLVKPGREYLVQVDSMRPAPVGPAATMAEQINTEIEILNSRDLFLRVLSEIGIEKVYPEIAANPPAKLSVEDAAVKALGADLSAAPVKLANVINITYTNADADIAVEVLNRLIAGFVDLHVQAFSAFKSRPIQEQVSRLERQIAELDDQRARFKVANGLFSVPEQRTALVQRREQAVQEILAARAQQQELQTQISYVNQQLTKRPRIAAAGVEEMPSRAYEAAQDRLTQLRQRQASLLQSLGPAHPQVIEGDAAVRAAERELKSISKTAPVSRTAVNPVVDDLESRRVTAGAALAPLEGRISELQKRISETEEALQALEENSTKLADMDREITALELDLRLLHDSLADTQMKEGLDQAEVSNVTMVEQPHAPAKPVKPHKLMFLLAGTVVGGLAALGALLATLTLRTTFVAVETIERTLGLPVLAALPAVPTLRLPAPRGLPAIHPAS